MGIQNLDVQIVKLMPSDRDAALDLPEAAFLFLVAKIGEKVVGTISFGKPSEAITKYSDDNLDGIGEVGSLYILPDHQGPGSDNVIWLCQVADYTS